MDTVFARGAALRHQSEVTRQEYAERVVRGGFPEAVARPVPRRRQQFFDSYVGDLITRDVRQLTEIERTADMRALLKLLAARSAELLVPNSLADELGLVGTTVRRYVSLLEEVYLVKRISDWSRNVSSQATSTPKISFVDSGVAANLVGADVRSMIRPDGQ